MGHVIGIAGIQVDRHLKILHALPERGIDLFVEIVPAAVAVYHRSPEIELVNTPCQLVRSGCGIM